MAITRFDEIPNLACYYSGHESTIVKSGDDVSSMAMVYGGNGPTLLAANTGRVQHNPSTYRIGQLSALYIDAASDAVLRADFPTELPIGSPMTAVLVTEADEPSRDGWSFEMHSSNSTNMFGQRCINGGVTLMTKNSSRNSLIPRLAGPEISIGLWYNPDDGDELSRCEVYVNDQENTELSPATPPALTTREIALCNRRSGTVAFGGKIGLFALYTRALTTAEITDVKALCQHWIDNGTPPGPGPDKPTTGSFTSSIAGGQIVGYQCRRDSVGDGVWYDVNDANNGLSNATVASGTLTINSAQITDNADIRSLGQVTGGPIVPSVAVRLTVES